MSRAPRNVRRALGPVLLLAVALAASACDVTPPAARVGDASISSDLVRDILETVATEERSLRGEGDETYQTDVASSILSYLVERHLLAAEADERRLQVSEADRDAARQQLLRVFAPGGDPKQGEAVFGRLPESVRDELQELEAKVAALQRDLGAGQDREAEAREVFEQQRGSLATFCLDAIVVETTEQAADAVARIEGGEEFAAVARDVSLAPDVEANGGDVGCLNSQQIGDPQLLEALAQAEDGTLLEPFGEPPQLVLLRLRERREPEFDDVRDQILASLPAAGQGQLDAFLAEAVEDADVEVDPRFGRWDEATGAVIPPVGPGGSNRDDAGGGGAGGGSEGGGGAPTGGGG